MSLFTRATNRILQPLSTLKIIAPFNLVLRDAFQTDFANEISFAHPLIIQGLNILGQVNAEGPKIIRSAEHGGQQLGTQTLHGRLPEEELKILLDTMGLDIRFLVRGMNGNNTKCLTEEDIKRWFLHLQKTCGDHMVLKIFNFINDPQVLEAAVRIALELGIKVEMAFPHTPDEGFEAFFKQSLKNNADIIRSGVSCMSAKRMVTGFTSKEVKESIPPLIRAALDYGVPEVGLHAHGPTDKQNAEFLALVHGTGLGASVDVAHRGSGGDKPDLFPSIHGVTEELEKLGLTIPITDKQWDLIEEAEEYFLKADEAYKHKRIKAESFTQAQKIKSGMPDGGTGYTEIDLEKANFHGKYSLPWKEVTRLFNVHYIYYRGQHGLFPSVTPGHLMATIAAIISMNNTMNPLLEKAATTQKPITEWTDEDIHNFLNEMSLHDIYKGIPANIVDIFRADKCPVPLSDEVNKFLRQTHMEYFLNQEHFKHITDESKYMLIKASYSKDDVREIAEALVYAKVLDEACLSEETADIKKSLILAAGKRTYSEQDMATDNYAENVAYLEGLKKQGFNFKHPLPTVAEAMLCSPDKSAGNAIISGTTKPMPMLDEDPEAHAKAVMDWRMAILTPPKRTVVISPVRLAQAFSYGIAPWHKQREMILAETQEHEIAG